MQVRSSVAEHPAANRGAVRAAGVASPARTIDARPRFDSGRTATSQSCSEVAQLAERTAVNREVAGSTPAPGANSGESADRIAYAVVSGQPPTAFRDIGRLMFPMLYETRDAAQRACHGPLMRVAKLMVRGDAAEEIEA